MTCKVVTVLLLAAAIASCTSTASKQGTNPSTTQTPKYTIGSTFAEDDPASPNLLFDSQSPIRRIIAEGESPFSAIAGLPVPEVQSDDDPISKAEAQKVEQAIGSLFHRTDIYLITLMASVVGSIQVGTMPQEYGETAFTIDNRTIFFDSRSIKKFHEENSGIRIEDEQLYEYYILDCALASVLGDDIKSRCEIELSYFNTFYASDDWDLFILNAFTGLTEAGAQNSQVQEDQGS